MDPRLDVVIVAYNCRELLGRCLRSLEAHPASLACMRVWVVDNASSDGTVEFVRQEFPDVELEPLADNVGFSAANNLVLRRTSAPYVLLLNPDTEVTAGALDHCLHTIIARDSVGMLGCQLRLPDGTFDHAAKRSFPTPVAALAHFTGIGRHAEAGPQLAQYRAPDIAEDGSGVVDAVNGAFMLVRTAAMQEVGLLDEGYWLYMEDLDWCYRFHQAGWPVWYEGGATVIHVKGGTSGARRARRQNVAFHRGMGRFYRKFYGDDRPWLALAVYVGIGAKLAISLTRNAVARGT